MQEFFFFFFAAFFPHLFASRSTNIYISLEGELFQLFDKKIFQIRKPCRFLASEIFLIFCFFSYTNTHFFFFLISPQTLFFCLHFVTSLSYRKKYQG